MPVAKAVEQRVEPRRPPDVPPERRLARRAGVERVDRRQHQPEVAGDELDRRIAERLGDQPQHLGVVRRRIAGLEDLEARLQVLARPVRAELLPPPDRPAIDVARRLGAGVHVQPHDRHGEVGAQHHLRPLVAGDEGARPDVLAVEVEQHVGRLQRRRLDPHRAGRAEHAEDPRHLGLEPGERRAHPRALQVGPVGDHQRAPRQHRPHRLDQPRARHLDLRRLRAPRLVRRDLRRQPRPERQVLELHHAARPLVAALDHRDRRAALVGILELPRHAAAAEEHLGPQPAGPQLRRHRLVAGHLARGPSPSPRPAPARPQLSRPFSPSAASSRSTPIETPVAGTASPVNRRTRPS